MQKVILWIIVIIVVAGAAFYGYKKYYMSTPLSAGTPDQQAAAQPADDKVQGQEVKVGTGKEAKPGTIVTVDYVGKLTDGTVFDSSIERKQPLTFTLGQQGIIPGFQIGVNGMKEGGERLLAIPPALGYGSQQAGTIPPNSTLVFDVTLLKVEEAPAASATTAPAPAKK